MRCAGGIFIVILLLISPAAVPAATVTFATNAVISETNLAYDGQDIVISGATVAIDGPHAFNSLLLTNGAVLTHSPCTASVTNKLDLRVAKQVAGA